ncbi:hypothetical protein AGMMS49965_13430 [Bacteroidia bacterium]|nr:hypothetical protein AGMMS49965_13430 [Bacteroidia bacterium]
MQFRAGYADQATSSGASINAAALQSSSWNAGLTLGAAINKNWELGVGVEYQHQKMNTLLQLYLPINDEQIAVAIQQTETKISLPLFSLYSAYYIHLSNRLYLTPRLDVRYGQAKEESTEFIATSTSFRKDGGYLMPDYGGYYTLRETSSTSKYKFFAMQLSPELRYFLSNNIGVSLGLGGVQLSLVDWEWDSKQWLANFNPAYWKLGLIVAF